MESPLHSLPALFKQLGLPHDPVSIEQFVASHSPLKAGVETGGCVFGATPRGHFCVKEILDDADWAVVVDELNLMLRGGRGV